MHIVQLQALSALDIQLFHCLPQKESSGLVEDKEFLVNILQKEDGVNFNASQYAHMQSEV